MGGLYSFCAESGPWRDAKVSDCDVSGCNREDERAGPAGLAAREAGARIANEAECTGLRELGTAPGAGVAQLSTVSFPDGSCWLASGPPPCWGWTLT